VKEVTSYQTEVRELKTTAAFVTGLALAWLALSGPASAEFINGNFSQGNTGFSSDYTYDSTPRGAAQYAIDDDPHHVHESFASFGDHTTGTGLMLIANGATEPDKAVWSQIVTTAADSPYRISAWAASALPASTLRFTVNGSQVGDLLALSTRGEWRRFDAVWNSAASTSAEVAVYETTLVYAGNDFALDDLSFVGVPEPGTLTMLLGMVASGAALALIRSRRARQSGPPGPSSFQPVR
jgi:hypothetical protein